jgi:hypothetical protein
MLIIIALSPVHPFKLPVHVWGINTKAKPTILPKYMPLPVSLGTRF